MKGRRQRLLAAALAAVVVAAAAISAASGSGARALVGGTYRVGLESFIGNPPWDHGFDPTSEYSYAALGIYPDLLVRTLVGYRHVSGSQGRSVVPDLAVSVPAPANGGTTYKFVLKQGVRFGPPVNREITSTDVRYAIERLARPANDNPYPPYFAVIRGYDAYRAGKAKSISGVATPNARTIMFTLTRPAGDFPKRLALPAAGPIPQEVAKCFEGSHRYGFDMVSSGPYMIEGADAVKIGSCGQIKPMSGISDTQLTLVRNPGYDPKTDTKSARENNPDRFVFVAVRNAAGIVSKLNAGELEDSVFLSSPKLLGKYMVQAQKQGRLRTSPLSGSLQLTMNLTRPPFDDIHVRRAMSWIVDRAALRAEYGGELAGPVAGHAFPDGLLDGLLKGYAPFKTPGDRGDLAKAQAEMAKSKYGNKQGLCVAKVCQGVHLKSTGPYAPGQRIQPIVVADAAKIGIGLIQRGLKEDVPASNNALLSNELWYTDYPDPSDLAEPLLAGWSIAPSGNANHALLGLTEAQAAKLGIRGSTKGVPSVDADIAKCGATIGAGRSKCYAALDRKVTTEIVPWIPFLWPNAVHILGPQVTAWEFDESTMATAYAHVAVKG